MHWVQQAYSRGGHAAHTHVRLSCVGTLPPLGGGAAMVLPVGERKGGFLATKRWVDSAGVGTRLAGSTGLCGVTATAPASTTSSSSVRSGVPAGDTLALGEPSMVAYKGEGT